MKYILVLTAFLVGCHHNPIIKVETIEVIKPVAIVPPPPTVPMIELLTPAITDDTPFNEVAKAYVHDVKALRWLVDQYQSIVNKYDELSKQNPNLNPN